MKRLAWIALLGWALVPSALAAEANIRVIEHVVSPGETLWSIAARSEVYSDPFLWPVIYKFNRDQITDPSLIYPSQLLQIPIDIDEETRRASYNESGRP